MIELWFAVRDSIGANSKVVYDGKSVLIKDLPARAYQVYRDGVQIGNNLDPFRLPGFLLDYCGEKEREGENLSSRGNSPVDIVSKLGFSVKAV